MFSQRHGLCFHESRFKLCPWASRVIVLGLLLHVLPLPVCPYVVHNPYCPRLHCSSTSSTSSSSSSSMKHSSLVTVASVQREGKR